MPRPTFLPSLRRVLNTLLLALAVTLPAQADDPANPLPNTIERLKPGVVAVGTVLATRRPPALIMGTGFAVANGRHILTNSHVLPKTHTLADNEHLVIFTASKEPLGGARRVTVIADDNAHDLALLRIEGGEALPALPWGDSDRVREGQYYAFTGFPIGSILGLYPVTHRAMISSISPIAIPTDKAQQLSPKLVKRLNAPYPIFQLDATAYPGNSGSPLYDPTTGQVVGILNKVFVQESKETLLQKPSGISYAIPINLAMDLMRQVSVSPTAP